MRYNRIMKNVITERLRFNSTTKTQYYDTGLCIRCGSVRDSVRVQCAICREKAAVRKKLTRQMRITQGICIRCVKPALPNNQKCQGCFFYGVADVTLKNVKMSERIATLFEEQGGRCAYTDEPLILGVNASIDHKTPQCRGGGHEIENLQWVSKRINSNKFNLTHDEFVAECASIAARFL